MSQNIYDDPVFFDCYSRLDRSIDGLSGAAEWSALQAMLPDMQSLNVLDLGCGYGWFCRWARENGAASVFGLDISERMLAKARSMTVDTAITYTKADLETADFPKAAFDIAFSSLAIHYLNDIAALFHRVHGALVPGGQFVFSTEHPIYMAPTTPGWVIDAHGRHVWPLDSYGIEGLRTTDWLADGVLKYHRMLGTTLNALIGAGFTVTHVQEWRPTDDQIASRPDWAIERDRPMFLLISACR